MKVYRVINKTDAVIRGLQLYATQKLAADEVLRQQQQVSMHAKNLISWEAIDVVQEVSSERNFF